MDEVQMPIVQVIDVVVVLDAFVTARFPVLVIVSCVCGAVHYFPPENVQCQNGYFK